MNIAVFADVHGRVALCFDLCARWQRTTGERIDLILQAGDLGAFPAITRADKATVRHAQKDSTELGFAEKFRVHRREIADLLSATAAPLVFVRGNHEDHEWLDDLEQRSRDPIFAVDVYERVFCLKTGEPFHFESNNGHERITILGIGRIGTGTRRHAPKLVHIQDHEVRRLACNLHCDADMLLTHDAAHGYVPDDSGLEEARIYLDTAQPAYHFFGHLGGGCEQGIDDNGHTTRVKLAALHWNRLTTRLMPGCFGLLRWKCRTDHSFEIVSEPWLDRYCQETWKYR